VKHKAIGERGSWFANVNGERLPCVHKHWVSGSVHLDPGYDPDNPKFVELVGAIRNLGKVVLTKDAVEPSSVNKGGFAFQRTGYIAVFEVGDVVTDENGLKFDLRNRVCELQS
jgi:hypothetical protein